MTKKQQELYDKQIKKLNEHCLGPSEGKFDKLYITPLQALENIAKAFSKVFIKDEPKRLEQYNNLMNSKEFKVIQKSLKAFAFYLNSQFLQLA